MKTGWVLLVVAFLVGCEETVRKEELDACLTKVVVANSAAQGWEQRYYSERNHSDWLGEQLAKPRPCRRVTCTRVVSNEGFESKSLTWESYNGLDCDKGPR